MNQNFQIAYFCSIWASNLNFVPTPMFNTRATIFLSLQSQRPHSELVSLTMELVSIPMIEIAKLCKRLTMFDDVNENNETY